MGNRTLNLDEYLKELNNIGEVFNKADINALEEKEKNDFS